MELSPGAKLALVAGIAGTAALVLASSSKKRTPASSTGAGKGEGGKGEGGKGEGGKGESGKGEGGKGEGGKGEGGGSAVKTVGGVGTTKATREEPADGWEARLETKVSPALENCRKDGNVKTYAEATECVLGQIFPEAKPWREPADWEPWMLEARQAVQKAIQEATKEFAGGWGAPGWQFALWLMFDRYFPQCKVEAGSGDGNKIVDCMAYKIYPASEYPYSWPPNNFSEQWQRDFYDTLTVKVADRLDFQVSS